MDYRTVVRRAKALCRTGFGLNSRKLRRVAGYWGPSAEVGTLPLSPARNPAAPGPRLGRRATPVGEPEDPHRLEPQRELLAAVRGAHVQPAELLHALQPVAHGVTVGEQLLRRSGHVAVGV